MLLDVGGVGHPLPPQAGWFEVGSPGDKDCDDGDPLPPQAGWVEEGSPPAAHGSRSDPSDWLHYDVCALSEFVLRVHSCVFF